VQSRRAGFTPPSAFPQLNTLIAFSAVKTTPKNFFIFSIFILDAHRIYSTIAFLSGQANNDVAWPLVS
jgi:hypothetical protein